MKRLPLTRGQWALVDDEDFDFLNQWKWSARWNPRSRTWYAMRTWHIRFSKTGKRIQGNMLMHRQILGLGPIKKDPRQVDHINHAGTDNRKENLRICNDSNQHAHQRKHMTNTASIYKGVTFARDGRRRPWRAKIGFNKRYISIGSYYTEIEAALAYDAKAIELFGDFKHLNFPMNSS